MYADLKDLITLVSRAPLAGEPKVLTPLGIVYPCDLCSYRGIYQDLALVCTTDANASTVYSDWDSLLKDLKGAVGKKFTGWKGGQFTMGPSTRIWAVTDYSETSDLVVSGMQHGYISTTLLPW